MEQKLGLELDLVEVLMGLLVLLWAAAECKQEVDDYDDCAEGRAHFVRHILVAVAHRLQLRLVFLVLACQGEICNFLGDVPHIHHGHLLPEVLHRLSLDIQEEG